MTRLRLGLALAVVIAAAVASAAGATVVVQQSIAGIKVNMTQAKVRSILGRPTRIIRASNEFGHYTEFRYFRLSVTFQGDQSVTNVGTTRRSERTASGIGVGSTKAQVKAKIRGVRCDRLTCSVGQLLPGRKVTTFFLRSGVVWRVGFGLVID